MCPVAVLLDAVGVVVVVAPSVLTLFPQRSGVAPTSDLHVGHSTARAEDLITTVVVNSVRRGSPDTCCEGERRTYGDE